jgi:acetyl-CoA C-acetyltransferase
VLHRAGLDAGQVHLFELNEAFAAQAVAVGRELGLDPSRVNTRGGAIALGHPIGASGARVLTTLIYALRARGGGIGVASLCIGGGMGIAMAVEV